MDVQDAIKARYCCKDFKTDVVPESVLKNVLALTQRAPSCFNTQPWVAVVVQRDQPENSGIVDALFDSNQTKVKDAPLSIVFCADLQPTLLIPQLANMMEKMGYPREESAKKLNLLKFVGWHITILHWLVSFLKFITLPIIGLFKTVPTGFVGYAKEEPKRPTLRLDPEQ
eukprot:gene22898-27680_t